jgi:hypothetical protein
MTESRPELSSLLPQMLTSFENPLQVPIQLPLNLLLPAELQERSAVLHPLSFLGKLPGPHRPKEQAEPVSADTQRHREEGPEQKGRRCTPTLSGSSSVQHPHTELRPAVFRLEDVYSIPSLLSISAEILPP